MYDVEKCKAEGDRVEGYINDINNLLKRLGRNSARSGNFVNFSDNISKEWLHSHQSLEEKLAKHKEELLLVMTDYFRYAQVVALTSSALLARSSQDQCDPIADFPQASVYYQKESVNGFWTSTTQGRLMKSFENAGSPVELVEPSRRFIRS